MTNSLDSIQVIISPNDNSVRKCDNNESNDNSIHLLEELFSESLLQNLTFITKLELPNCELKEIPLILKILKLKHLNISGNKIYEVPSCLYSGLELLISLDLSHNYLQNFDIEPACYGTLQQLYLNHNRIDTVPQWMERAKNLKLLVFSHNRVKYIDSKKSLNNLEIVKFENCGLNDVHLPFFFKQKKLQELYLGNDTTQNAINSFSNLDEFFESKQWLNLKILNLNNVIISILSKALYQIDSLVELYIQGCELSWISPDIEYLVNLKILDISNNGISSLPPELSLLENLEILKASKNFISSINQFTSKLKVLDLFHNSLEEYPEFLDTIEMIDLEMNFFDTSTLQAEYTTKRDALRNFLNVERYCGQKYKCESIEDRSSDYTDDWSIEKDVCDEVRSVVSSEENWEEEVEVINNEGYVKHELITSSDEEFCGDDIFIIASQPKNRKENVNIDWLFCDVD